jgi:TonB family protein
MKLLRPLTLAATLSCLLAAGAQAQAGRVRRGEAPAPRRGGGQGTGEAPEQKDDEKPDADGVYSGRQVTRRAVINRKPLPGYPREARRHQVTGAVVLRVVLRADGRVDDKIEVLKSLPYGVTEEAIRVARQIEFEPAEKDGRKVSQRVTVEYNFNIY